MASIKYNNFFDAVTENEKEANELQNRADLMIVIRNIVLGHGWKQAEKLASTQPRLSNILDGKIDKFSIDRLVFCLYRLGYRFKPIYKDE